MNRDTLTKGLTELVILFPQKQLNEKLIDVYERHLRKIPEAAFAKVLDAVIAKSKFFPTVSDFLEVYQTLPKPKAKAIEACVFCESNGLVWMRHPVTLEERYFLCPKACQASQHYTKTVGHIPPGRVWESRSTIAKQWCAEHQDNFFVKAIQKALDNCKNLSYEEAQAANQAELVKLGNGLGIKDLTKVKPWDYPSALKKGY
jgi:hypothetical protein